MDAFAVSICKGLSIIKVRFKDTLVVGLWFGIFQTLMPYIGYSLGNRFEIYITTIDHWIAFFLLFLIGILMIKESTNKDKKSLDGSISFKVMSSLAIATSIDALAVGVSYGILPNINIWIAITSIGIITLFACMIGVKIGNVFGTKYKSKAELIGGIILIIMGGKILIEHLL